MYQHPAADPWRTALDPATIAALTAAQMTDAKGEAIRALLAAQAAYLDGIEGLLGGLLTNTELRALPVTVSPVTATFAGENHIGQVGTPGDVIKITPALDTLIYAAGDTLFDRTLITNAVRVNAGVAMLQSLTLIDKDDQGAAMDLYLLEADLAFGTINAAPSITDANAESMHYIGSLAATDWKDLGGVRVASLKGIGLQVKAGAGTRSLWLAAVTQGTPTHTAAGLVIKPGFVGF